MRRQPEPGPTFQQRFALALWLMQFPSLSVMVYLRRDIGYRLANPLRLIAVSVFMVFIAAFTQRNRADDTPLFLIYFAGGTLALGIFHRIKGWWQYNRGVHVHSYYLGSSLYEFRWLPEFVLKNRRFSRFIDPLICALAGYFLRHHIPSLSAWLTLSGVALYFYEFSAHEQERNLELDAIDSLIEAKKQSRIAERFEDRGDKRPQQQAPVIPSGIGADIERQISISVKQRKANTPNKPETP